MSAPNSPVFGNLHELDTPHSSSGYLWVDDLGAGVDGVTQIVWSCAEAAREGKMEEKLAAIYGKLADEDCLNEANGGFVEKFFVRKKTKPDWPQLYDLSLNRYPVHLSEICNFREHPRIPQMMDWIEYKPRPKDDIFHLHHLAVSMIFKFCNGNTLKNVLEQYREHRRITHNLQGIEAADTVAIPEAFIWKVFGQVLEVANWIRHARPGVSHNDIHIGNVFLHFDKKTASLPDCYLGDFGRSFIMYSGAWDASGTPSYAAADPRMDEYDMLLLMLKELMVLQNSSDTAGGHEAIESDWQICATARTNYSALLYEQIFLFDCKIRECRITKANPDFSKLAKHMIDMGGAMDGLQPQSLRNVCRHYPSGPRTYKSANEMVEAHKCQPVARPWKVAKIRANDKAVLELSKRVFHASVPAATANLGPSYLIRSESDNSIPGSARDVSLERM